MWKLKDGKLNKEFKFENFLQAVEFVNKLAKIAEKLNHHPDICIYDYNKMNISIFTHSEGKVTEKDYKLAEEIDMLT